MTRQRPETIRSPQNQGARRSAEESFRRRGTKRGAPQKSRRHANTSALCPRLDLQCARQRMRGCGEALGRTSITLEMRLVSRGSRTYAAVLGKVLTAWENPFIHILQMSKCYMNKYAYDLFNDISWQQEARPLAIRGQTPKGHFERSGAPPLSFRAEARSAGVEKPRPRVPRLGAGGGAELSRGAIKGVRVQKEHGGGESRKAAQETPQKCMKSETFSVYQSEKLKPVKLYREQIKNLEKIACRTCLLSYLKS